MSTTYVDWEKEAKQGLLGYYLGRTKGISNAEEVGAQLGDAILQLEEESLIELNNVHLVAHSLGAHLMSYAANRLNETGKIVGRITGLNPAGPLYSTPPVYTGLRPSSANFVVGLHTDPLAFGSSKNVGHVDIWLNCGMRLQPGCPEFPMSPFTRARFCSNNRAPLIYSEALANTTAFPAIQAESCSDWRNNSNGQGDIIFIGENIDPGTRGKFYLKTNDEEPFGQGDAGLQP
ncbi:unnamed protein product [Colias eurytheme]|nr:unnamed protein product [Colias eurytheme]